MDEGQIVVDSIASIELTDMTHDLVRESGFNSAEDLLQTAKHGSGDNIYLIRFHYLRLGAWEVRRDSSTLDEDRTDEAKTSERQSRSHKTSTLLQRIRNSSPLPRGGKDGLTTRRSRRRRD
jgi:hypothetical protein